jgi:hypothetical protein
MYCGSTIRLASTTIVCFSLFSLYLEWNNLYLRESSPFPVTREIDMATSPEKNCYIAPIAYDKTRSMSPSAFSEMEAECQGMDESAIESCSIPNVVHFVWYLGNEFRLDHYLSARSIYNALKPDAIFVHGREFPDRNLHFDRAVEELGFKLVKSREISDIFGIPVTTVMHKADILRMETLIRFGGMYFDFDILALKPFLHFFRNYETVMPTENDDGLQSGIILAKRCSRFMLSWYRAHRTEYKDNCWGCSAIILPKTLADRNSPGIHVDHKYMKSDWPLAGNMVFSNDTSPAFWDETVAVHSFIRIHPEFASLSEGELIKLDNNYGRIVRNILSDKLGF